MSRLGKVLASIAVCVTLLAALPTGSLAQTGKGRAQKPVVTYGRLAELTPAHLTITLTSGTQKTIALSAQTRYVALTQATAVAGLREGEYVAAYRHDNGDTTPAGRILYDLQPFGQPGKPAGFVRISGTVADSPAGGLTIRTASNDLVTVKLQPNTRYIVNGQPVPARPTFRIGEAVRVLAHRETDGSLNARVVSLGRSLEIVTIAGTVADSPAGGLTIRTSTGDLFTVSLTSTTIYYVNGARVTGEPSLHIGEAVRVTAHVETDGSLTARVAAFRT